MFQLGGGSNEIRCIEDLFIRSFSTPVDSNDLPVMTGISCVSGKTILLRVCRACYRPTDDHAFADRLDNVELRTTGRGFGHA